MKRRGQAVVEMALGSLVFVTILVFGIHFAELAHITLKVQEAANSALWDATSQQMHDVTAHEWTQYTDAITFGEGQARNRYADFDALRNGSTTSTQVFTRAENSTVTCGQLGPGDRVQPSLPMRYADATYPTTEQGITCTARAELTGIRIPRSFLDGNLSQAQHFRPITIPACGIGRPSNGNCPGRLAMLLDDWGYVGQQEARQCALAWEGGMTCENQGYWDQVSAVYLDVNGTDATPFTGAATRLASLVAGASPIEEDFFFMSFRGSESQYGPYAESVQFSHGDLLWETTPFQMRANAQYDAPREDCWLGKRCPP